MAQRHFLSRRSNLVGSRIRDLRKSRNLTQTELSERTGILQSDLSRMENGEYKVGLDQLFKILAVFDLDMASFFEENSEARPADEQEVVREYLSLDEEARREVRDFIRFKRMQKISPEIEE
jgi:transcriptional regulator with XRE-family HTH domain